MSCGGGGGGGGVVVVVVVVEVVVDGVVVDVSVIVVVGVIYCVLGPTTGCGHRKRTHLSLSPTRAVTTHTTHSQEPSLSREKVSFLR